MFPRVHRHDETCGFWRISELERTESRENDTKIGEGKEEKIGEHRKSLSPFLYYLRLPRKILSEGIYILTSKLCQSID